MDQNHSVIRKMELLGCKNKLNIKLAFLTYLELCEVHVMREVNYHFCPKFDLIYVSSKEKLALSYYIPVYFGNNVNFQVLNDIYSEIVQGDDSAQFFINLRDLDTTSVFYKFSPGLLSPPSMQTAAIRNEKNEKIDKRNSKIYRSRHKIYDSLKRNRMSGVAVNDSVAVTNSIAANNSVAEKDSVAVNDSIAANKSVAEEDSVAVDDSIAANNSVAEKDSVAVNDSMVANKSVAEKDSVAVNDSMVANKSVAEEVSVAVDDSIAANNSAAVNDSAVANDAMAASNSFAENNSFTVIDSVADSVERNGSVSECSGHTVKIDSEPLNTTIDPNCSSAETNNFIFELVKSNDESGIPLSDSLLKYNSGTENTCALIVAEEVEVLPAESFNKTVILKNGASVNHDKLSEINLTAENNLINIAEAEVEFVDVNEIIVDEVKSDDSRDDKASAECNLKVASGTSEISEVNVNEVNQMIVINENNVSLN